MMFMQANDCKDHKRGNSHDRSRSMILIAMIFARAKNQNNRLVDDVDCVFNCDDDRVDKSSVRPNTQQSAKVASRIGAQVVVGYTTTG